MELTPISTTRQPCHPAMHRIGWCIVAVVLLCTRTACADYQLTQSASNVECYEFLELTLKSDTPIPGNPFTDVQFTGRFSLAGMNQRGQDSLFLCG